MLDLPAFPSSHHQSAVSALQVSYFFSLEILIRYLERKKKDFSLTVLE